MGRFESECIIPRTHLISQKHLKEQPTELRDNKYRRRKEVIKGGTRNCFFRKIAQKTELSILKTIESALQSRLDNLSQVCFHGCGRSQLVEASSLYRLRLLQGNQLETAQQLCLGETPSILSVPCPEPRLECTIEAREVLLTSHRQVVEGQSFISSSVSPQKSQDTSTGVAAVTTLKPVKYPMMQKKSV